MISPGLNHPASLGPMPSEKPSGPPGRTDRYGAQSAREQRRGMPRRGVTGSPWRDLRIPRERRDAQPEDRAPPAGRHPLRPETDPGPDEK